MRNFARRAFAFALLLLSLPLVAQQPAASGKWKLYKFEQPIGEESYQLQKAGDDIALTDHFLFTDRGTQVPLDTRFTAAQDLTPKEFDTKGKTSRQSTIDASVVRVNDSINIRQGGRTSNVARPPLFFTISGYSPIAQQMLMLRYWLAHGKPTSLRILPQQTDVHILDRGTESVEVGGKNEKLTRYSVAGLIWGRESLWMDEHQNLVAAVTTDAEFDHFEATAEGYESVLPKFVAEAGADGMAALEELSRGLRVAQQGPLAIVGATLVDGTGKPAVPDSAVIVANGRIVAAGPRASVRIPKAATVFDAAGKTLLPGLWDMHAHFEQVEWGPIYLAAGVTTVRDCGNELEFIEAVRNAIRSGRGLGPELLLAGIVDGSSPMAVGVERVDSPSDAAHWVDVYHKAGFQQMKIYSSVKLENVKAITEDAHKVGMTVTGHIPNGMNIYQGVEAGMDQVNHIQYVMEPLVPRPPPEPKPTRADFFKAVASVDLTGPEVQKLMAFLKEHNTVIDPTLVVFELQLHPASEPVASFEPGVEKVAPELREPLTNTGMPPDLAPMATTILQKEVALVGLLHKSGVRVMAGTDQTVPGHSLHRELELYVQAGFTPMEAIQAATLVPAQAMGLEREVGTVEAGKRADLILLDRNPLDDIHNIRTVRYVVADGVLYPTDKLWESVGFKP